MIFLSHFQITQRLKIPVFYEGNLICAIVSVQNSLHFKMLWFPHIRVVRKSLPSSETCAPGQNVGTWVCSVRVWFPLPLSYVSIGYSWLYGDWRGDLGIYVPSPHRRRTIVIYCDGCNDPANWNRVSVYQAGSTRHFFQRQILSPIDQMSRLVCCCHTFRPLADATILHVLTATRKTVPRAAGMNHPRHGQSSTQKDQTESCADDDINPESFETVPVGPLHAKKRTKQKASNHHIESHESYSFQIFLQKKSGPIYLGRFG